MSAIKKLDAAWQNFEHQRAEEFYCHLKEILQELTNNLEASQSRVKEIEELKKHSDDQLYSEPTHEGRPVCSDDLLDDTELQEMLADSEYFHDPILYDVHKVVTSKWVVMDFNHHLHFFDERKQADNFIIKDNDIPSPPQSQEGGE